MKRKLDRETLLDDLVGLCKQGQAENEPEEESLFLKHFLPIRTHYRILEPDVHLIIGDKGAGKTQVFRALSYPRGRTALTALAAQHGRNPIDLSRASWQVGFASLGKDFPPGGVIREFARTRQPVDLQTFWLALLVRVLVKSGEVQPGDLPEPLRATFQALSTNCSFRQLLWEIRPSVVA